MRYSMSINVNYGNMKLDLGDDYKMAINRYNKVKKDFASIPCEMSFIDEESHKPLFVKVNKQNSFDTLYKQLIEILTEMSKLQTNLTKKEKYNGDTIDYHALEMEDTSKLTLLERSQKMEDIKLDLAARRLIKEENQKAFAFSEHFNRICEEVAKYETNKYKKLTKNKSRYKEDEYYTETISAKKNRTKRLLNILNNK